MDRLPVAILVTALVGLAFLPLSWLDGPLWPDRVITLSGTYIRSPVLWWLCFEAFLMASTAFPGRGQIWVFPDHVRGGIMGFPDIPRAAIVSVERWTGPLFDVPWQAASARLNREGFARNRTLGRFSYHLTRQSNAVVIRWTGGTPLVVTPDDPDGFVEALRPGGGVAAQSG